MNSKKLVHGKAKIDKSSAYRTMTGSFQEDSTSIRKILPQSTYYPSPLLGIKIGGKSL